MMCDSAAEEVIQGSLVYMPKSTKSPVPLWLVTVSKYNGRHGRSSRGRRRVELVVTDMSIECESVSQKVWPRSARMKSPESTNM
jgi:hypothetical protein